MKHRCPITGCTIAVPHSQLMCPAHWSLVPKPLGDALYRAYRSAARSNLHFAAMNACTDHVNNFLAERSQTSARKNPQPKLL